ncbi:hypothetical protein GIB67_019453 [Kingdonia uniflora]|uniref:Multidrug and toxic compound extrusion protein n=1 Tax=Kingdonia uniflora TaxID=39325 RepID=A0A7J7MUA2_9MAGN|nr:hypothetical protein GIB67_019453 [Kingdonia uniflora]
MNNKQQTPVCKPPSTTQIVEELKELWGMALPITAMNCVVYIRAMVSVVFLGRLGSLELAGGALSIGFTNITGYSVLVGLASGLEPVVSQAYGSKNWDLISLSLLRTILILLVTSIPISVLWMNLERIMLFLGQDSQITSMAATYCFVVSCTIECIVSRSDEVGVARSGDGLGDDEYEYVGVDVWVRVCIGCKRGEMDGWDWRSVWWNRAIDEVGCTKLLGNLSRVVVVGNELGAGNPQKAKLAAIVALGCAFIIGIINIMWTAIFRYRWAGFFTKDELVCGLVAAVMPIMGLCELGNCPQTTGCGVLRGTARPAVGARINLGSFYCIGTPIAVGLAFWLKLGFGGLWYGLLSAQLACVVSILFVILMRTDWEAEALRARKLSSLEMSVSVCDGSAEKDIRDEEQKGLLENV